MDGRARGGTRRTFKTRRTEHVAIVELKVAPADRDEVTRRLAVALRELTEAELADQRWKLDLYERPA